MKERAKVLFFSWLSPFLRGLILEKLSEVGCEVKILFTYQNVVEVVAKEKPDMILGTLAMDMGMNGYEAIELLKKDYRTKDIPFIVLTNSAQKEEKEEALKLGATDYLVLVEWTVTETMNKIKEHLENKNS